MIYLFSHDGKEIDGVYQSHPIRTILVDTIYDRLWALNPMNNSVYYYAMPNQQVNIRQCFQHEQIVLNFADQLFQPSAMIQSDRLLGLIDTEHDLYRLYVKDNLSQCISEYTNPYGPQWKLTDGVIFSDNRTLLQVTENKYFDVCHPTNERYRPTSSARRRLIELTANGNEKRHIQADKLYSMTLGMSNM
jgi:hypothetical protein